MFPQVVYDLGLREWCDGRHRPAVREGGHAEDGVVDICQQNA